MRVLSESRYQPTLDHQQNLRPIYIKTSKTNNKNRRVLFKSSKKQSKILKFLKKHRSNTISRLSKTDDRTNENP